MDGKDMNPPPPSEEAAETRPAAAADCPRCAALARQVEELQRLRSEAILEAARERERANALFVALPPRLAALTPGSLAALRLQRVADEARRLLKALPGARAVVDRLRRLRRMVART
jgi:hypothetical protein